MIVNRIWAMANKWTFQIPPITELISRYVGDGKGWIDPFAGMTSPAEITNDLNPEAKAKYHLDAESFANKLNGHRYNGVLFDPPYSMEQCKRSYESYGYKFTYDASQQVVRWTRVKELIAPKIEQGGYAISFGWNSNGFGKCRGFECIEVLLVCHGGAKNDTIVTVERKIQGGLCLGGENVASRMVLP